MIRTFGDRSCEFHESCSVCAPPGGVSILLVPGRWEASSRNQVECQEYKIISYIDLQLLPLLGSSSTSTIVEWVLVGGESYWDIETVFGFPLEMTLLSVKECC